MHDFKHVIGHIINHVVPWKGLYTGGLRKLMAINGSLIVISV